MMQQYGFTDDAAVISVARLAFENFAYAVELMPRAWRETHELGNWDRMVSVRLTLLQYICGAYALREKTQFARGCDAFIDHGIPMAKLKAWAPTRTQLLPDIGLAICRGRLEQARAAAETILAGPAVSDQEPAAALMAYCLASLQDLDYTRAEAAAGVLAQACEAKRFSKRDTTIAARWAQAASQLARRDPGNLEEVFGEITKARHANLRRELTRRAKGLDADVTTLDLWDWRLAALRSIASDFGFAVTAVDPFADFHWVRAAR